MLGPYPPSPGHLSVKMVNISLRRKMYYRLKCVGLNIGLTSTTKPVSGPIDTCRAAIPYISNFSSQDHSNFWQKIFTKEYWCYGRAAVVTT